MTQTPLWHLCTGPAGALGIAPPMPTPPAPHAMRLSPPPPPAPADPVRALADSCLRHGRAAVEEGRLHEALAWFDRAIALDAKLGVAHFCRAMVLAQMGQHDEADAALQASVAGRAVEDAPARVQLARMLARHGQTMQALRVLGPALTANRALAPIVAAHRDFYALRDHPIFAQMVGRV